MGADTAEASCAAPDPARQRYPCAACASPVATGYYTSYVMFAKRQPLAVNSPSWLASFQACLALLPAISAAMSLVAKSAWRLALAADAVQPMAPTSRTELEEALKGLDAKKDEWARLPAPEKAKLLRRCLDCTLEVRAA